MMYNDSLLCSTEADLIDKLLTFLISYNVMQYMHSMYVLYVIKRRF